MNASPIGIFDSGIGGLTILETIQKRLPHESFLYLADTLHLPYGDKSAAEILSYTRQGAHTLVQKGIKLLVLACHTASCATLPALQNELPVPVVGMVGAGLRALQKMPDKKRIALLATQATIQSGIYQTLIQNTLSPEALFPIACPLFTPLIEKRASPAALLEPIASTLAPLQTERPDVAFLACTHYPLIEKLLFDHLQIPLVEPSKEVAEEVANLLFEKSLAAPPTNIPSVRFFKTGPSPCHK